MEAALSYTYRRFLYRNSRADIIDMPSFVRRTSSQYYCTGTTNCSLHVTRDTFEPVSSQFTRDLSAPLANEGA